MTTTTHLRIGWLVSRTTSGDAGCRALILHLPGRDGHAACARPLRDARPATARDADVHVCGTCRQMAARRQNRRAGMSGYTAAPWEISRWGAVGYEITAGGCSIAIVNRQQELWNRHLKQHPPHDQADTQPYDNRVAAEANARLIAEAPLLADLWREYLAGCAALRQTGIDQRSAAIAIHERLDAIEEQVAAALARIDGEGGATA